MTHRKLTGQYCQQEHFFLLLDHIHLTMGWMRTSIHIQENFLHRESNLTFALLLIGVSSSRDYIITPFHEVLPQNLRDPQT